MKKFALALAVVLASAGCAGSLAKTASNDLVALKAGYVAANASRIDYCKPLPEPKPVDLCKEQGTAYKALLSAYETLKTGDDLLAAYVSTKSADSAAKLKAFLPVVVNDTLEILKLSIPGEAVKPPAK